MSIRIHSQRAKLEKRTQWRLRTDWLFTLAVWFSKFCLTFFLTLNYRVEGKSRTNRSCCESEEKKKEEKRRERGVQKVRICCELLPSRDPESCNLRVTTLTMTLFRSSSDFLDLFFSLFFSLFFYTRTGKRKERERSVFRWSPVLCLFNESQLERSYPASNVVLPMSC